MVMNSETGSSENVSVLKHSISVNHFKTYRLYHLVPLLHDVKNSPTVNKPGQQASYLPCNKPAVQAIYYIAVETAFDVYLFVP